MSAGTITFLTEDPAWRKARVTACLKRAALAARKAVKAKGGLTVLLAVDGRLRDLNHDFRGKDKPTNVLSFPAGDAGYMGDIAIAYGVARREAEESGKRFRDHAAHLVVHGVLHLAGYDHIRARDAKVMERLEVEILDRLGIANPYEVGG